MNEKVLAKVNGKEITQGDLDKTLQSINPQQAAQFQTPEGQKQLLQEIVKQELILCEAKDNKYDEELEFNAQLDQLKNDLLKQYAIQKLISTVTITEDEINKFYEDNKESFKAPEMVDASHILVDAQDTANEVIKEINEGLSFKEAALKFSKCPSKSSGGNLGFFPKGKMVKEFEDAAFDMEKGKISDPVKSQFGYHIIKINDKKDPQIKELNEVKDTIKRQVEITKQTQAYSDRADALQNKYKVEYL